MANTLGLLFLSILVCKIQADNEIEVSTNVQYSQFLFPQQSTLQPNGPALVPVALPSTMCFPPQYFPQNVPETLTAPQTPKVSISLPQPAPPVLLPPIQVLPPNQIPNAINYPSFPAIRMNPPPVSVAPPPVPVVSPLVSVVPPPVSVLPPPVSVLTPPVNVLPPPVNVIPPPVSVNLPTVKPSAPTVITSPIAGPAPISMISTTIVDNSLANKLANVLQLFLVSKTIDSQLNCFNSPYFTDVSSFFDAIGTIGASYAPITEIVTPAYQYGLQDIVVPSIYDPYGAVTEVYPYNVDLVPESYVYSPLQAELLLPAQSYVTPYVNSGLDQIVYI